MSIPSRPASSFHESSSRGDAECVLSVVSVVAVGVSPAVDLWRRARRNSRANSNTAGKLSRQHPGGGTHALYGRRDAHRYANADWAVETTTLL